MASGGDGMTRGWARSRRGFVTGLAFAALLGGCGGDGTDGSATDGAPVVDGSDMRFPGSTATLDGLGRQALQALAAADTAALEALRLTEAEHNDVVWPELPASRSEANFPVDYAWSNIQNRNRRSLARILPQYAGKSFELEDMQCRGGTRAFATFQVLTDCWAIFTVAGQDGRYEAQLFKDVVVRGGGHKIFRYYDEPPRRHDPASET